jgi:hypothetical protein
MPRKERGWRWKMEKSNKYDDALYTTQPHKGLQYGGGYN